MYTKKLSELRGLEIAVRVVLLAVVAIGVGVWFGSTAGFVAFAIGLVLGVLLELRPDRDAARPLARATAEGGPHRGRHLLVVANTSLDGEELARELAGHGKVDVLAPPLMSRLHVAMSDSDREVRDAQKRLDTSLAWAREHGLEVHGEVGDTDPLTGIADELRGFGADEVVVVDRANEARHITRRELEALRKDLRVPVREIAI